MTVNSAAFLQITLKIFKILILQQQQQQKTGARGGYMQDVAP